MMRALFLVLALLLPRAVEYPDPVPLYPDNYTVLFENDQVRVLDFRLARGARETAHSHPAHVAVFLADFQIEFTAPDGTKSLRDAHHGQAVYSAGTVHASENIGKTDGHGILIELKQAPKPAAAGAFLSRAAPAAAANLAGDGNEAPAGALTAVTLIHGIAGKADDLKRHLLSLAPPTRAEEGNQRYDLYQSPDLPHEFMRYEIWSTPQALERHKQAPHLRASWEKRQREGWTTQIMPFNRVPEDRR